MASLYTQIHTPDGPRGIKGRLFVLTEQADLNLLFNSKQLLDSAGVRFLAVRQGTPKI